MKEDDSYKVIERYRERIKPENKQFVSKNIEISNQIIEILKNKGHTQRSFAALLEKQESEVSKWLSGLHNLTLQSITKMETVLNSDIIVTPLVACQKYAKIKYITLKVYGTTNQNANLKKNRMTEVTYDNQAKENIA